jgi:hypothetical protein
MKILDRRIETRGKGGGERHCHFERKKIASIKVPRQALRIQEFEAPRF